MAEPSWSDALLALHMDGADASTMFTESTGKALSVNGATISTAQSKFGGSSGSFSPASFTSLYARNSDFVLGSGDFTVEGFVKLAVSQGTYATLFGTGGISSGYQIYVNHPSAPGKVLAAMQSRSNASTRVISTTGVLDNAWHHIAVSRTSGVLRVFIDGVLEASATVTHSITSDALQVGFDPDNSTYLSGHVDDLRVSRSSVYSATFTPRTSPFDSPAQASDSAWGNVALLMHMNGAAGSSAFVEEKGKVVTPLNGAVIGAPGKFGTGAAEFNGLDSNYLQVEWSSDFVFGSNPFCIEFWVKTTDADTTILDFYDGTAGSWEVSLTAGKVYLSNGTLIGPGTTAINDGTWHHVAIDRYAGQITYYVDTAWAGVVNNSTNFNATGQDALYVGGYVNLADTAYDFTGSIDELRITNGKARYFGQELFQIQSAEYGSTDGNAPAYSGTLDGAMLYLTGIFDGAYSDPTVGVADGGVSLSGLISAKSLLPSSVANTAVGKLQLFGNFLGPNLYAAALFGQMNLSGEAVGTVGNTGLVSAKFALSGVSGASTRAPGFAGGKIAFGGVASCAVGNVGVLGGQYNLAKKPHRCWACSA